MNGYWNVYNRDGEEFKIHVKNDEIPSPSFFTGQVWCEFRDTFCLAKPEMCCPNVISIHRKSKNNLVLKEHGTAREIWMRDEYMEEQILMKKLESLGVDSDRRLKFVELMEK